MSNQGKIVEITEKNEWETMLESIGKYDFYHTFDYHKLSLEDDEQPVLLVFEDGHQSIALPLLIRKIPDTDLYDATSVYGYAGPLSNATPNRSQIEAFQQQLKDYLREKDIVSLFTRMNPFIDHQESFVEGLGTLNKLGKLVTINLANSLDEQRSQYRRDTRGRVNKLRRTSGVHQATSEQDINTFIEIYTETMNKLEADDYYFFSRDYFYNFLKCDGFKTEILLTTDNESGEVTAGSMFVITNDIVQYHLSGTRPEHMRNAPMRLLLDEMRIKATEMGLKHFNLGGGFQCQEDALYDFKSSFSNEYKYWYIWKYVVNEEAYAQLAKQSENSDSDFFPVYRAPAS